LPKKTCSRSYDKLETYQYRLITARLQYRHTKDLLIQIYAPTSVSDYQVKDDFYDPLSDTINETPNHDLKILMGDVNALIDSDRRNFESIAGPHGTARKTNDNGERFKLFCSLNYTCHIHMPSLPMSTSS